jgi:hypothetical protein
MDGMLDNHDRQWRRAMAAAKITISALERDLPHMALDAAREAARSALLVLAAGPHQLSSLELGLLRDMARATSQHLAGRPAELTAMIRATLSVVGRLLARVSPVPGEGKATGGGGVRRRLEHTHPRARAASRSLEP